MSGPETERAGFPVAGNPPPAPIWIITIAYPNGPTADHNLGALCRGNHRVKTLTTWTVTQDDQAKLTWTSPTGQRYTTYPGDDHPGDDHFGDDRPKPDGPDPGDRAA